MSATILDGKALSRRIESEIAEEVVDFIQNNSIVPCLAAVLVGEDRASQVYVRNKQRACQRVGIESQLFRLDGESSEEELLNLIAKLNKDHNVHGILVQLPLPRQIVPHRVLQAVHPNKDVDAFHPENVGRLVQGRPRFLPCTPHGIQELLLRSDISTVGKRVVILGRSDIVGKPLAILLAQKGEHADATVTLCHSRTVNVEEITRQADILVAAVGRPRFVTAQMIKPNAVVIDVGIHQTDSGLVGDVDFDAVREVASHITPVPGGVGPLTITMLLGNTLRAARDLET